MKRDLLFALFLLLIIPLSAQDLYDINSVSKVELELEIEKWDKYLDSLKELGNDDRVYGSVKLDDVLYDSVGVRYKGNSSYFNVRNSGASKLPSPVQRNKAGFVITPPEMTFWLSPLTSAPPFRMISPWLRMP